MTAPAAGREPPWVTPNRWDTRRAEAAGTRRRHQAGRDESCAGRAMAPAYAPDLAEGVGGHRPEKLH
jgi:hypothetical protein